MCLENSYTQYWYVLVIIKKNNKKNSYKNREILKRNSVIETEIVGVSRAEPSIRVTYCLTPQWLRSWRAQRGALKNDARARYSFDFCWVMS